MLVVVDGKYCVVVLNCARGFLPEEASSNNTIMKPSLVNLINEMTCKVFVLEVYNSTQMVSVGHQPHGYVYSVVEDWCINAPFKSKQWRVGHNPCLSKLLFIAGGTS
jgi:hypothetical protein